MNYLITGTNMRGIMIFTLSIGLTLLINCHNKSASEVYRIINKSSYPITIKSYSKSLIKQINISVDEVWISQELDTYRGGARSGDGVFIPDFNEPDSLIIIFNDLKVLRFNNRAIQSRHLLNFTNNYEVSLNDNKTIFTYIFTNKDYNNAEEIGGD